MLVLCVAIFNFLILQYYNHYGHSFYLFSLLSVFANIAVVCHCLGINFSKLILLYRNRITYCEKNAGDRDALHSNGKL